MARHTLNETRPGRPRPEDPRPDGAWRHAGAALSPPAAPKDAAGVPAQLDVYHCDMHAFDMMRPQDARSVEAAETFNRQFAYARAHYFAPQREADDGEGRVR